MCMLTHLLVCAYVACITYRGVLASYVVPLLTCRKEAITSSSPSKDWGVGVEIVIVLCSYLVRGKNRNVVPTGAVQKMC